MLIEKYTFFVLNYLNLLINVPLDFCHSDLAFIGVLSFRRAKEKAKCFLKYIKVIKLTCTQSTLLILHGHMLVGSFSVYT